MLRFSLFATLGGLVLTVDGMAQAPLPPAEAGVDHAKLIRALDEDALKRGETLYQSMCLACHGTPETPGSLPLSRAFWKEPFKNGGDPLGIYRTLTTGLGQMPPWPMLTPGQKHDLAHFIRERYVKTTNPAAYVPVTEKYLAELPKPKGRFVETAEMKDFQQGPKYLRMDFGPSLMWTLEAAPGNIAYKGITIRLDEGGGGVSKGRAWMLYDHDTMRVAAAWSGDKFVDWRGIAFDGSHGTHTKIAGATAFVTPNAPGWANPATGTYTDARQSGLDSKPYGPLPRSWMRFRGMYHHGQRTILSYTIGKCGVLETPGCEVVDGKLIFTRDLEIEPCESALEMRVADAAQQVTVIGAKSSMLSISEGFHVLRIPVRSEVERVTVRIASDSKAPETIIPVAPAPKELASLTKGGPPLWPQVMSSPAGPVIPGDGFEADTLEFPEDSSNPWRTQWRPGGLDFFADGKRLALCTWMGDVWLVDGLLDGPGKLQWRRIAAGLNQPLGLKIVNDMIHITCRDQLVRLRDLNGDGETDFYECFNSDHQVTEHFHEFAMGLQADDAGNFYYAKSARHALPPLVPQHGTLLRVSADGSNTEILANGFRAANGVCVNDDGTFFVTDQEGHWTPKNRINLVKPGKFYGNMWSYGAPADSSDSAMEQPLVWITNDMDRSPGELVRVTPPSWGPLRNKLLDLSYGMGRMFLILHDESNPIQGAAVAMPMEDYPTGVMRGRHHPATGDLYTCGMAVWATNKTQDGGLYRMRRTSSAMNLPVSWRTSPGTITVTFSDPLDRTVATNAEEYDLTVWNLKRGSNYGSKHINERPLQIRNAALSADGLTIKLSIPDLAPTQGLALQCHLKAKDGAEFSRSIHATIHRLGDP